MYGERTAQQLVGRDEEGRELLSNECTRSTSNYRGVAVKVVEGEGVVREGV